VKVTWFPLVDTLSVAGVAFEDSQLVEVVFEVGDDGGWSVLEKELD
jgi:hypothetical protein